MEEFSGKLHGVEYVHIHFIFLYHPFFVLRDWSLITGRGGYKTGGGGT